MATESIAIVGMPASGKSRVGVALADLLNFRLLDLDMAIEEAQGMSISQIFQRHGEEHFRKVETAHLEAALSQKGCVISLGGGVLESRANRSALRKFRVAGGLVVYIETDAELAKSRISKKDTRPIFVQNGLDYWDVLLKRRSKHFIQNADIRIKTSLGGGEFLEAEVVAEKIFAQLNTRRVLVERDNDIKYSITIGRCLIEQIPTRITPDASVAVLYTESVADHKSSVVAELKKRGLRVSECVVADAENGKTVAEYERTLDFLAERGFTRSDFIIAIGGGALTDMAGLVAASFLRGVQFINVPTSTLAAVDASTGGKTGINLRAGKNLCGAFYEPEAVYIDLDFFKTLHAREFNEGLGEALKMGLLFDQELVGLLFDEHTRNAKLEEIVYRCVKLKAEVVSKDLYDSGLREFLNYGHTFAHAVEKLEHFKIRHGEAVALGCIFAAHLAFKLGMLTEDDVKLHYRLVKAVGLPYSWGAGVSFDDVLNAMRLDKKNKSGTRRFVLLDGLQNPRIVEDPELHAMSYAFEMVQRAIL
ncbi:MAG: 3-dehydroquinate synthase [Candidatus Ancillula sp.]|jgi:shikimate kinase/3-dehydroquinate synthase|nr:3-dehydroquinate synthase [Candidatus Ancillula sp.]